MPSKASEGKVCMVSSNFRLMFGPTGLRSFRREALNSEHPGPKPEEHRKHAFAPVGIGCVGLLGCRAA